MNMAILAEFKTPEALLEAIEAMRLKGYRRLDAFTPHPFHGLEEALHIPRSWLNSVCGPLGIAMALAGYGFQWFCNAYDYPIDVGGRPPHAPLAFVPITFETGVLWTSLLSFIGLFIATGLTSLYRPIFDVPGFERASLTTYWLGVAVDDRMYNSVATMEDLSALSPLMVTTVAGAKP